MSAMECDLDKDVTVVSMEAFLKTRRSCAALDSRHDTRLSEWRPTMLLAPRPDVERNGDSKPSSVQHLVREIGCICLAERASHALRDTGYSALREIIVFERDGAIVLEGRVASYHLKQLAQEAVRQAFGGAVVCNELEVTY